MLKIGCKTCHLEQVLDIDKLQEKQSLYFHCNNCGPLFSSYSFTFIDGTKLIDFKFCVYLKGYKYEIFSTLSDKECAIFKSKVSKNEMVNKELLIELGYFYPIDFNKNITKQMFNLVRRIEKIQLYK